MSKSSLITVLALIASVSAKPYGYGFGTLPYAQRTAYTAAELYNPAAVAPVPAAYFPAYPTGYPTAYSAAYSGYPGSYAPLLSGTYSAPLPYSGEELAVPYNLVSSLAPVASVGPLIYASPQTYVYKR